MKRPIILVFIAISLFSCSKEKNVSIVGDWIEEAVYSQSINGYQWEQASSARDYLKIANGSQYVYGNERCGNAIGSGSYQYNQATKGLTLIT